MMRFWLRAGESALKMKAIVAHFVLYDNYMLVSGHETRQDFGLARVDAFWDHSLPA